MCRCLTWCFSLNWFGSWQSRFSFSIQQQAASSAPHILYLFTRGGPLRLGGWADRRSAATCSSLCGCDRAESNQSEEGKWLPRLSHEQNSTLRAGLVVRVCMPSLVSHVHTCATPCFSPCCVSRSQPSAQLLVFYIRWTRTDHGNCLFAHMQELSWSQHAT